MLILLIIIFLENSLFPNCNATFGSIKELQADLQAYANAHIESSYELLLMSTQFGNYESNRDGFKALYRKLSDKTWEDAINIIKFITKRGGRMNFNQLPRYKKNVNIQGFLIVCFFYIILINFFCRGRRVKYYSLMKLIV